MNGLELTQIPWHTVVVEAEKMRGAAHRDSGFGSGSTRADRALAAAARAS